MERQLNVREGLDLSTGLTREVMDQIKELELRCNGFEDLHMRLNWDTLESRPKSQINDLLYYDENHLVGYLGLQQFGTVVELTGMVSPQHRRQGIFRKLWTAAMEEIRFRGISEILVYCEEKSTAGKAAIINLGGILSHSELKMAYDAVISHKDDHTIELLKANTSHIKEMARQSTIYFGGDQDFAEQYIREGLEKSNDFSYIFQLNGECVGKIHVRVEHNKGIIFGFGILPEFRGLGHGREALNAIIAMLQEAYDIHEFVLEVDSDNVIAKGLYEACGFKEIATYNYYNIRM